VLVIRSYKIAANSVYTVQYGKPKRPDTGAIPAGPRPKVTGL